jgi:DnaJ family protein C protein 13
VEAEDIIMDYQVFLVRQGGGGGRSSSRAGMRLLLLRVLEHGISVLPLSTNTNSSSAVQLQEEYSFEHIAKVTASQDDPTELCLEVLDMTGGSSRQQGGGHLRSSSSSSYDTLRFFCDSRSHLLTVLLNRIDDFNGIGEFSQLPSHAPCQSLFRKLPCSYTLAQTALQEFREKIQSPNYPRCRRI